MIKKISCQKDVENSKHFCILPWIHAHALPDGTILPCCVSDFKEPYGNLKKKSLNKIWNNKSYKTLRKNMLLDMKSNTCRSCYELENSNCTSMRMKMNKEFIHHAQLLEKTNFDGSFDEIEMKYLDIRFSNICNFKCRGCSPICSSQWNGDYIKLWDLPPMATKTTYLFKDTPMQKREIDKHLETLEVAYFAGGEPLIMDEHYYCLEKLIEMDKDIPIHYNSNLSVLNFKNFDLIELWRNFSTIVLNISIDDIESRGEYFRKGLNWDRFLSNVKLIKSKLPQVQLSITCTITLFNIHRIPVIHNSFLNLGLVDEFGLTLNQLQNPIYYRTQILPTKDKRMVQKALTIHIMNLEKLYPQVNWDSFKSSLLGVIDVMNKQDLHHYLYLFKKVTKKLDRIRNESFKVTYPELSHLIKTSIMIFIPLRNQEAKIEKLLQSIKIEMSSFASCIFFFDENSSDETLERLTPYLTKLKTEHKLVKFDKPIKRSTSYSIAATYAKENNIDFILTIEEGWEDCIYNFKDRIISYDFTTYDTFITKRVSNKVNFKSFIDLLSSKITSVITRIPILDTKGDAIHIERVEDLDIEKISRYNGPNYFYSILLSLIIKRKKIYFDLTPANLSHSSLVKINIFRLLFIVKELLKYILIKLKLRIISYHAKQ